MVGHLSRSLLAVLILLRHAGGQEFSAGPVKARPSLEITTGYDNNLYFDATNRTDDTYLIVAPGIHLQLQRQADKQDYMSVGYQYRIPRFFSQKTEDAEEHILAASTALNTPKSTVALSHQFSDARGGEAQVGDRVTKIQNVSSLAGKTRVTAKTAVGLNYALQLTDYETDAIFDSSENRIGNRFYYRAFPKTDVYLELLRGWVNLVGDASGAGDARYYETSAGMENEMTKKTSVNGSVGYQHRDVGHDVDVLDNVVVSMGLMSQMSPKMSTGLTVLRKVSPSISSAGTSLVETHIVPQVSRKLLYDKVTVSLSGAYGNTAYSEPGAADNREDDAWEASTGVFFSPLKHLTVGVGYAYMKNDSSIEAFSFDRENLTIHADFGLKF